MKKKMCDRPTCSEVIVWSLWEVGGWMFCSRKCRDVVLLDDPAAFNIDEEFARMIATSSKERSMI